MAKWIGAVVAAAAFVVYAFIVVSRQNPTAAQMVEGAGYLIAPTFVAGLGGVVAVEAGYWIASLFRPRNT